MCVDEADRRNPNGTLSAQRSFMKNSHPSHAKAINMLALATIFWGLSFPVMKALGQLQHQLLPESSSWFGTAFVNTLRFGAASVLMALFTVRSLKHMTRSEVWQGFGLGFFGGVGCIFQMDGLNYTSASTSAFLTQAYCIVLPVILAIRTRRWPPAKLIVASLLVIIGITILSDVSWGDFKLGRGETETLIGSMIFAGQILWLERPAFRDNNVNHFSLVMFTTIAVIGGIFLLLTMRNLSEPLTMLRSGSVHLLVGQLVIFCTLIAYVMMNHWQPKISSTEAGLIYCVEPVFASLFALFLPAYYSGWFSVKYPNELVTQSLLWGGSLILAANILLQFNFKKSKNPPTEPHT